MFNSSKKVASITRKHFRALAKILNTSYRAFHHSGALKKIDAMKDDTKHLQRLKKVLFQDLHNHRYVSSAEEYQAKSLIKNVASYLAENNDRFNHALFMDACCYLGEPEQADDKSQANVCAVEGVVIDGSFKHNANLMLDKMATAVINKHNSKLKK